MKQTEKGFIPVMLTPFKENGAVDYEGLTKLTAFYLESGASGLFANCLSSEMFELSPEERLNIIKHVVSVAGGAVPVVATGTFGVGIREQADFVKKVYEAGTQAVILISSLLAVETEPEEVFEERTFALLDATEGVPVGFYECPVPYKRLLPADLLGRLVATGRVTYHKDTSLDLGQIREKLKACNHPGFGLYDAYMVHAVESLRAGSAGLSCIQGNFFPELIVWLCQNFDNPELAAEVDRVQQFLAEHMDVMHYAYPLVAKYFLQKRGLEISSFTRRQTEAASASAISSIDSLFDRYACLRNQLMLDVAV